MRHFRFRFVAILILLCTITQVLASSTTVRTEKGGKILLYVDDESVRTSQTGKPFLIIDGPNILKEKGGKRLFFIDGDILHTSPEGPVCGYIDGRHVMTKPRGTELFYIDGNEIKPNHDGKILYYTDDILNNQQLMAVLYTLRPDAIKRPADPADSAPIAASDKATPAPAAAAAKPASPQPSTAFAGGTFSISDFKSSDGAKHSGTATVTKVGDVFAIDFKFTDAAPLQGIAVQKGDSLFAATGELNTIGLVDYQIAGATLTGTWMNATGNVATFGNENLVGPATFGGSYNITSAKAPFTGAPYAGTVAIELSGIKPTTGDAAFYQLAWALGAYKVKGVAIKIGSDLVGVSSTAGDCSIARLKIDPTTGILTADFLTVAKVRGSYKLKATGP